jgi:RNA polymerase sigma factor (TIGR02999 family)
MNRDLTSTLCAATSGDAAAAADLLPAVYDELRRMAARMLRRERAGHTLQPTALAHEAFLKLIDQSRVQWQGRVHFLAVAATAMRRILVNHAKARGRIKRGGPAAHRQRVPLDDALESFEERAVDLEALDEALQRLAAFDPQQARLVELRFFGGMTVEEAADALGISVRTVHREWDVAKAWLRGEVDKGEQA